jgi:hypothetical protein
MFNGRLCRVLNKSPHGVICLTPEKRQAIYMNNYEVPELELKSAPEAAEQNSACKVAPADDKIGNRSEKKKNVKAANDA